MAEGLYLFRESTDKESHKVIVIVFIYRHGWRHTRIQRLAGQAVRTPLHVPLTSRIPGAAGKQDICVAVRRCAVSQGVSAESRRWHRREPDRVRADRALAQ